MDKEEVLRILSGLIAGHEVNGLSIYRMPPDDNGQGGTIDVDLELTYADEVADEEDEFKTL
jgi:hypothetical protein